MTPSNIAAPYLWALAGAACALVLLAFAAYCARFSADCDAPAQELPTRR